MQWSIGKEVDFEVRTEKYFSDSIADLSILYLSDFHINSYSKNLIEALKLQIDILNPDIILLGGDYIETKKGLKVLEMFFLYLSNRKHVFAISGNHDYWFGIERIKDLAYQYGIEWIDNKFTTIKINNSNIAIIGNNVKLNFERANLNILCLHKPVDIDVIKFPFDIVFAGHLHGCQIVWWQKSEALYPGKFFYHWNVLKKTIGQKTLYLISKGLGDTLPIRINCKHDIVLVKVENTIKNL